MLRKHFILKTRSAKSIALSLMLVLLTMAFHGMVYSSDVSSGDIERMESLNKVLMAASEKVNPAVVNISTMSVVKRSGREFNFRGDPFWERGPFKDFFGDDFFRHFEQPQEQSRRSLGSGVIVDKDGYILTNNHVVKGAEEIKVTLGDKREFEAKLVGADKETDVAIIKIDAKNLPAAELGDSENLKVGQWILAIGNPFGLSHTVTWGIISATGRSNVRIAEYEDFIQTDAAINPGNSGGPMINIRGEVIGINTAIATASGVRGNVGVGFAIPINMARNVMEQLIDKGKVVRGWLGVQIQEVSKDIAEKYDLDEPHGALISVVSGPAEKAGLEPGDLIIEFDGETVKDSTHLRNLVAALEPGKKVVIKAIREGKEKEFDVKLGERTEKALAKLTGEEGTTGAAEEWMGMVVQELTDELARRLGYEDQTGVLIADVDPDGPAAKADPTPQAGDLIQEIEGQKIKNMDDYREAIRKVKDQKSVMIRLRRATGNVWYVVLKKE